MPSKMVMASSVFRGQKLLGGICVGSGLHDGGRVDDLTAHLLGGLVHGGQTGTVSIGAVDDTGIHTALADLRGHFLNVGAVGDDTGSGQSGFVQIVVSQDLLGVLAHGYIAVAHAEEDVFCLQVFCQRIKAVDALLIALRHAEHDLVFQQVHAAVAVHKVQSLGVHLGRGGAVQLVHLLLTGRDEEVAVCALLDLGLEGARRIKVEAEGHIGVLSGVSLADSSQGLGQRGGCKNDEFYRLTGSFGGSRLRGCGRRGSAGRNRASAGSQGSGRTGDAGSSQKIAAGNQIGLHGNPLFVL